MILFTYLCSKICLLLNTPGQLARRGAGVMHAGSRRGYLKKNSRIELCMVDKGFGGRQYQKTTLASITSYNTNRIGGVMVKSARLECGRSWVRAPVGSYQRLYKLIFVASLVSTQN